MEIYVVYDNRGYISVTKSWNKAKRYRKLQERALGLAGSIDTRVYIVKRELH